jgi:hypothetical protein
MVGNFPQSNLRIELEASETAIRDSLLRPNQLQQWLWPQQFSSGLPEEFARGLRFTSWLGPGLLGITLILPSRIVCCCY